MSSRVIFSAIAILVLISVLRVIGDRDAADLVLINGNIVTVDEDPWLTSNGSRRVLYSYLEID